MRYFNILQKNDPFIPKGTGSQIIRIMKLTCIILMTIMLQISATGYSQITKLDVRLENVTVKEVFKTIEAQSEFRFFYSDDLSFINKRVSLNMTDMTVESILNQVLDQSNLTYRIFDNNLIVVTPESNVKQGVTITGTVTDAVGATVPGVNVMVKGTSTGVVTGSDGKYSIAVPNRDAVLVFSFMGYATEEIAVSNRQIIDVVLHEDAMALGEVVVTALGMARDKKALGYAITEIKGDEIARSNTVNPINAMQGKVAGVQINMGAAGPQSSQRILIRGNTSLAANNQPIFVVDGVIVENEWTKTGGWEDRDFGNALKNLNSDDFESVSILKGAAATALYGSRASNGVILVTTKKGKKGEGLGISFSHTQQWEKVYRFPDYQNEFGMGTTTVWTKNADGSDNRTISTGKSFGPAFDGLPYTVTNPNGNAYNGVYQAYPDNGYAWYQTGRYINTNLAVSGGTDRSTFRFSYSNLNSTGISLNNNFKRNNFLLNASHDISRLITAQAGFNYVQSNALNPTYQGDRLSPVYDLSYSVPREYDAEYWKQNRWSPNHDAPNNINDPWGLASRFFEYMENNHNQMEENYRGYLNLIFNFTDWLAFTVKADMNRTYTKNERKRWASYDAMRNYSGSQYWLNESQNLQYKGTAMLTATHKVNDFSFSASLGAERFHADRSFHNSTTNNGLRAPGVFELNNSVNAATTDAYARINQRRINSVYGFINADWKGQVYLDVTGRNDWSSTLRYADGSGNVSYFYPSLSASWLLTETFKGQFPEIISFAKLRASYAIVGNGCDPYQITDPGSFQYRATYTDTYFGTGQYAYFEFANNNLGAPNLQPEKQHSIELGFDFRMFQNRLGVDFAYYKTNTRNQILTLPTSSETGVTNRIINAGDIQNQGIELLLTGTVIKNTDWMWDLSFTYTLNKNKIVELYPGVTKYQLRGGSDIEAWATSGGAYGDLYSSYAYKRNDKGEKLLDQSGQYLRSNTSIMIGNSLPKFLGGLATNLRWKSLEFHAVLDSRFGGQIWSGSYNYGMSSGVLKSSLTGRTKEYGGLEREVSATDNRKVFDGMIPEGVFQPNSKAPNGTDISGMTYQKAYDQGLLPPLSASAYYDNLYNWGRGIREAAVTDISWVAVRELSLFWNVPKKWTQNVFIKDASIGFSVRNVGYLYNSLPDHIHPEGLRSNHSAEFQESGGAVYSRNYAIKINLNF